MSGRQTDQIGIFRQDGRRFGKVIAGDRQRSDKILLLESPKRFRKIIARERVLGVLDPVADFAGDDVPPFRIEVL